MCAVGALNEFDLVEPGDDLGIFEKHLCPLIELGSLGAQISLSLAPPVADQISEEMFVALWPIRVQQNFPVS